MPEPEKVTAEYWRQGEHDFSASVNAVRWSGATDSLEELRERAREGIYLMTGKFPCMVQAMFMESVGGAPAKGAIGSETFELMGRDGWDDDAALVFDSPAAVWAWVRERLLTDEALAGPLDKTDRRELIPLARTVVSRAIDHAEQKGN